MNTDPLIGRTIGNFHIERMVGRGGMAQVYFGTDVKLQRPVAVKVIDARYRGKTAQARRFIKEARLMAQWKHENIVQVFSADDEGDLYYYVMEYVDGEDLASIMSSYASNGELMPITDVIRIGCAVAGALDYAHSQQIIHRDVKPSNVLVARDGRVMLSDFGLALDMQDGSDGEVFGTAHYISPEQARRSADAIPQSDLYSLGVILYEMLTGVVPFHDPSPTSVALQHITVPPPSPRTINPELSEQVEAVLLKSLEKEADKRYQSGDELMGALETALTAATFSALTPLPPLPLNVPTVKRMMISRNTVADIVAGSVHPQFQPTVRSAGTGQPEVEPTVRSMSTVQRELGQRASSFNLLGLITKWWVAGVAVLVCLASILFVVFYRDTLFRNLPAEPVPWAATVSAAPALPSATEALPTPAADTSTPRPIVIPSKTRLPATSTPSPMPTATVKYPEGHLFKMIYDEDSFYLINLSEVTRTVATFSFERRDARGFVERLFNGWEWDVYFPRIFPDRCMGIVIDDGAGDTLPSDCDGLTLSLVEYPRDDRTIFWTASENSGQFLVLWKGVEVGRCEVSAGVCEVRVP